VALRTYIEASGSWMNPSGPTDNQWLEHDLSQYGVPSGAVAEIAISNIGPLFPQLGGVRATSGSINRYVDIMKSEPTPGDTFVTMNVQVDASGRIDYFSELFIFIKFDLLGYWPGCEYVERIDTFDPVATGAWEGYALDQYGVSDGQVVDILMTNSEDDFANNMGVRTSGSFRSELFDLSEAEDGGFNPLAIPVVSSGSNSAIEIYTEDPANTEFGLLGYFSDPPGTFVETTVFYPEPSASGSWSSLDVGSSGLPNNGVACLIVGRGLNSYAQVGLRETDSAINRSFDLSFSEESSGRSYLSMAVNIDSSGYIEQYSNVFSPDEPQFVCVGYWTDFINDLLVPINNSANLFIEGHRVVLYKEVTSIDKSPLTTGSWQTVDLSSGGCSPNSVAEILVGNKDTSLGAYLGVRASGSSLDRHLYLRDSPPSTGNRDIYTWHVALNNDSKAEVFSSGVVADNDDVRCFGYWTGCNYVELYDTFQIDTQGGWVNHNLLTYGVPVGKVVEIVIMNESISSPYSGGVRQVGSTLNRLVDLVGIFGNSSSKVDAIPMFVNTSGENSTIQVYAESSGSMSFGVVGYWQDEPGLFTELITSITPKPTTGLWEQYDLFTDNSIPSGVVAHIALGNSLHSNNNILGVRGINTNLIQRLQLIRATKDSASSYYGVDFYTSHVNVTDGYVEFYHFRSASDTQFTALGYWDIFQQGGGIVSNISSSGYLFTEGISFSSASSDLFTQGHKLIDSSGNLYSKGHTQFSEQRSLYINGLSLFSTLGNLFITGTKLVTASSNLYIQGGVSLTLYACGHEVANEQLDLFTHGIVTFSDYRDLFVHGYANISGSCVLYTHGSGIIDYSENFGLFVNGFEPKPSISCPILDTSAAIQIKTSLITTYQNHIDALINQLGKNVNLEFDPIREPCPNCEYDTIRNRSTGIYIPDGPRPFARGRRCPYCKGRGFTETAVTKCIKCLIQWNPEDAEKYDISVERKKGIVRFKTYLTEADDLLRARTVLSNYDIAAQMQLRVKLVAGPIPVGLREDRYCISFWELI